MGGGGGGGYIYCRIAKMTKTQTCTITIDLSSEGPTEVLSSEVQLDTFMSQRGAEYKVCHDAAKKMLIPFQFPLTA